jgi:hypothetical protein
MGFLKRSSKVVTHQQAKLPERSEEARGLSGIRDRLAVVAIEDKPNAITISQFKRQKMVEQKQDMEQLKQRKDERSRRIQGLLAMRQAHAAY